MIDHRPERVAELSRAVRAREPRFGLEIEAIDDIYADQFERELLTTRVVGAFGLLAFALAAAGVYTLMTFLVSHRVPEIAVRIAVGAAPADVRRLIFGSSLRLIVWALPWASLVRLRERGGRDRSCLASRRSIPSRSAASPSSWSSQRSWPRGSRRGTRRGRTRRSC